MTTTLTIHLMIDSAGDWVTADDAEDLDAAFEEQHGTAVGPTAHYALELELSLPTTTKISAVIEDQEAGPVQMRIVK